MTAQELFEMIAEHYDYNKKEIVQAVNELSYEIYNNSVRFSNQLDELTEEYALDDEPVCPMCGSELELTVFEESRGEYQGFFCGERVLEAKCTKCDYILG